jgi:hypothetical protein
VKGADGNDPSASNPVFVAFRSATLTDGAFTVRKITGAMSLVVSSGSTLGHASAKACHAFVYLIDYNSGTVELAVSNLPPDYPGVFANTRLISTTAEGGAGAADSATGIYSTTARSNVPWVCVAKILTTQTTAGTWDSAVTQLDQAPFSIQTCAFAAYASSMSVNNATATKLPISSEIYDPDSTWDAVTNYRHQPSVAGVYRYSFNAKTGGMGANNQGILYIQKNGASDSLNSDEFYCMWNTGISPGSVATRDVLMNGTSDYVEFKVYQSDGAARNFNATGEGARVSGGQ